ncbi:MAG: TIGR02449 family protein [Methylobacter sp.]|nr:TIGR02449 family protein [Methylobacter sp.]
MKNSETHQILDLKDLEDKLDELIDQYNAVKSENTLLKSRQEALVREKEQLLEKTTLARIRVEAMITRLKAMEHNS